MPQSSPTPRHPPKPRLTVRVGVTGHRPNKLSGEAAARVARQLPEVYAAIEEIAAKILRDNAAYFADEPPAIRLVCGFAEGVDQMAVAACPERWQIEAVLPFPEEEYRKDFRQSATGDGRDVTDAFVDSLKRRPRRSRNCRIPGRTTATSPMRMPAAICCARSTC